jgi:hypothetical protein
VTVASSALVGSRFPFDQAGTGQAVVNDNARVRNGEPAHLLLGRLPRSQRFLPTSPFPRQITSQHAHSCTRRLAG